MYFYPGTRLFRMRSILLFLLFIRTRNSFANIELSVFEFNRIQNTRYKLDLDETKGNEKHTKPTVNNRKKKKKNKHNVVYMPQEKKTK